MPDPRPTVPPPTEQEKNLHLKRLLAPKSAIHVKRADALCRRHEIGSAFLGYARDKVENGGFGCAIVPGRKSLCVYHSLPPNSGLL
jgi:hypothetical protein